MGTAWWPGSVSSLSRDLTFARPQPRSEDVSLSITIKWVPDVCSIRKACRFGNSRLYRVEAKSKANVSMSARSNALHEVSLKFPFFYSLPQVSSFNMPFLHRMDPVYDDDCKC